MNDLTVLSYLAGVTVRTLGLATIAWAAMAVCRVQSPAVRHAVWSMAAAGMLLLAALSAMLPDLRVPVLPPQPNAVAPLLTAPFAEVAPMRTPPSPSPVHRIRWNIAVAAVYLLGLTAFAGRLVYAYLLTRRLIRGSRRVQGFDGEEIYESVHISVPLTVGWLRPKILLPADWEAWPPEMLEAVLVHERTHIARADWAIAVLAGVNRCAFWFHPLAWWIERQLTVLAEQACDDAALGQVSSRECYAQTLVDMAATVRSGEGRVAWEAMAMAKATEVRVRVERILDESRQIFPGLTRARWFTVVACGLPLIYMTAVVRPARVRAQETAPSASSGAIDQSTPTPPAPAPGRTGSSVADPALKAAREDLDRIDAQVARFKRENMGRLPEQFQTNVAQLNIHQMMIAAAHAALSRLQQQKLMLETQLQNNYTNLRYYDSLFENPLSGDGSTPPRNENLIQLNQRILTMQAEVATLQEQLTPNHPTLKRAQATLETLEKRRQEAGNERQAVIDLNASNSVLKTEIQNLNLQMDEKVKQAQELNRLIANDQQRIESSPELEQQYAVLLRDQELAQQRVKELSREPAPTSGPNLISRRDPEYTAEARQAGIQGTVEVAVTIGTDGVVRDAQVIRKLDAGLDRKAIECVKTWRFRPAMRNGQPVTAFASVEVKFRLP